MLIGLDPLLDPDLLAALARMGHGDEIALCDANFPADSVARETVLGRPLRVTGAGNAEVLKAILSVLPLDPYVEATVRRMEVVGDPVSLPPIQLEARALVEAAPGGPWVMGSLERHAFYAAAKQAFAVVATGETRSYGCFLIRKGVIAAPPA